MSGLALCALMVSCAGASARASSGEVHNLAAEASDRLEEDTASTEQPAVCRETLPPAGTSAASVLQATDPASVRLDSGRLQLLEFFRFT